MEGAWGCGEEMHYNSPFARKNFEKSRAYPLGLVTFLQEEFMNRQGLVPRSPPGLRD